VRCGRATCFHVCQRGGLASSLVSGSACLVGQDALDRWCQAIVQICAVICGQVFRICLDCRQDTTCVASWYYHNILFANRQARNRGVCHRGAVPSSCRCRSCRGTRARALATRRGRSRAGWVSRRCRPRKTGGRMAASLPFPNLRLSSCPRLHLPRSFGTAPELVCVRRVSVR